MPSIFPDVPENEWYTQRVEKAYALDLLQGYPDGMFKPMEATTRAELADALVSIVDNFGKLLTYFQTGLHNAAMRAVPKITDYNGPVSSVGSGSGVMLTPDGYIVTNHHVVEGYLKRKTADPANKYNRLVASWSYGADLIGYQVPLEMVAEDHEHDLALLKVTHTPSSLVAKGFPWMRLAATEEVPGEPVVVMGAPLGVESWGAPAYVARDEVRRRYYQGMQWLIPVAGAINPGNSGGALVRASDGTLLGIPSMKYVDTAIEGMGFAIHHRDVAALMEKAGIAQPA